MKKYQMWIQGEWTNAASGKTRTLTDPGNGEELGTVPEANAQDVARAIGAARQAFDEGPWRKTSAQDRGKLLWKIAEGLRARTKEFAELETRNNGKPLRESEFDVADAANCFEFYAGFATKIHGETMDVPSPSLSFVLREPIGVCAQIIPWNFPLLMAAWKLAPALAAGNVCILKPSELTPLTALELCRVLASVGLPPGVVNVVTGTGPEVGEPLSLSPLVDKVAFTGGTATGRRVMTNAAVTMKKVSLELGGKNPNVVFADCDFDAAVDGALFAAFANQGEVCSAGSRLLVQESIHKKFVDEMVARTKKIKMGHGLTSGVNLGPLISAAHQTKVEGYLKIGTEEGAKIVCGGKRGHGEELNQGFFVEPTIFDHVAPKMRVAREEIFGPVLSVLTFKTEEEAIALANDTDYGLAAAVWTKDIHRGLRTVKAIRAGITWVNTYHLTYNELPWGGYKQSGTGRELGLYGIEEYLETKQVNLHLDEAPVRWF